jgi:hypothetical protein
VLQTILVQLERADQKQGGKSKTEGDFRLLYSEILRVRQSIVCAEKEDATAPHLEASGNDVDNDRDDETPGRFPSILQDALRKNVTMHKSKVSARDEVNKMLDELSMKIDAYGLPIDRQELVFLPREAIMSLVNLTVGNQNARECEDKTEEGFARLRTS